MELSVKDTKMTKGLACIFMVLLHLFCRTDNLPYECLKIGGVPLVYYIGLFADQCVAIYCFCSGYALYIINQKYDTAKEYYKNRLKSLFLFIVNYWIVLVLFSLIGLVFDKTNQVPGDVVTFFKHFFFIDNSYNGAWWFVLIYILLVFFSRICSHLVNKYNSILILVAGFTVYVVAYFQRTSVVVKTDIIVFDWFLEKIALFGTSVFPFVVAMIFAKHNMFSKLRAFKCNKMSNAKFLVLSLVLFVSMIIVHKHFPSLIVAPFTGIVTIVLLNLTEKGKYVDKFLEFFGNHSTNIWLVHMFFYSTIFEDLVFIAKYPFFIFAFMMCLCIVTSMIINVLLNRVNKIL